MADEQRRDTAEAAPAAEPPAVDVRRLAEKVYRLMLEDLRLDRARAGRAAPPREGRP